MARANGKREAAPASRGGRDDAPKASRRAASCSITRLAGSRPRAARGVAGGHDRPAFSRREKATDDCGGDRAKAIREALVSIVKANERCHHVTLARYLSPTRNDLLRIRLAAIQTQQMISIALITIDGEIKRLTPADGSAGRDGAIGGQSGGPAR